MRRETKTTGAACLTISRYSGVEEGERAFSITIEDEASGFMVVKLSLSGEELARALTCCMVSDVPCEYGRLDMVGIIHECKTVFVPASWPDRDNMERVYQAAEAENEGWRADRGNWNGHRFKNDKYEVILRRYLEPEPSK